MPYILTCTCGTRIPVQTSQAGTRVACPTCGEKLDIPTIRGLKELEIDDALPSRENPQRDASKRWNRGRGMVAATCFLVATLGLGRAGLYACYRFMNPISFSESAFLDFAWDQSQQLSAAETWDLWTYLQESGLGAKRPPSALIAQRTMQANDRTMLVWGMVGGIGLLGLLFVSYRSMKVLREGASVPTG